MRRLFHAFVILAALGAAPSYACVGIEECMTVWSTEDGGGALTIDWDFAQQKVQTFRVLCAAGECLYSAIDPGFLFTGEPPREGFHTLADGTDVRLEIVTGNPAATLRINGEPLREAPDAAELGTTPDLHVHPSWQLRVAEGVRDDFTVTFKLTTDSPLYADSAEFPVILTNLPTATPSEPTSAATPTATPTPAPPACPGDCDDRGSVTIDELVLGVSGALGTPTTCTAFDLDHSGTIAMNELITAVNAALIGCPATPTPTATMPAMFDVIQATIFSPRCALPTCHDDAAVPAGMLHLTEGQAHAQLVGVAPTIDTARDAGLLRVDPFDPDNSFLLVKLQGPPPDQGSRMPQTGPPLTNAEVALIRQWIAEGAQP